MKERIYNTAWGLGVRVRNAVKRVGILGPVEPLLSKMAPILIHPPRNEFEITLPWGMKMEMPAGYPAGRSYAAGVYESSVTCFFREFLRDGMTVVDVGANIGYYSLLASNIVGMSGKIYAFEPDPTNYAYLLKNIEVNSCFNVFDIQKAVYNKTGTNTFIRDTKGTEGFLTTGRKSDYAIVVQTITLDDFFAQIMWPNVDFIKIDIEGSEFAALEGMRELIQRNPRIQIVMEYNMANLHRSGVTRDALITILQELGFHKGYVIERGMKPFRIVSELPRSHATYDMLFKKD